MTEQLKTMMERAATQDFAVVDLDAITSAGDRTVRRRRVLAGVAGVAVLAVIGTTAALVGGNGDGKADFSDDPFRTNVPMWTVGSTLHTPEQTYDLGVDVLSFARTSEGIVFTGVISEERLGVYSFTGAGEPIQIGETSDPHVRTDPDGPYAGWLDQSGDGPEAVVIDQGSGERIWSAPARLEYSFPIVAIDGSSAYLADADEHPTHVVDLVSGEETDIAEADLASADHTFVDVEGDLTAYALLGGGGGELGLEVRGTDGSRVEIRNDDGDYGVISPGGGWISAAAEDVGVYDTSTGDPVDLGVLDDLEGFGYSWADADTLLVLGESPAPDALVLQTCEIPSGDCNELTTFDDFNRLFSVGDSDLLFGLMRDPEVSFSSGPAELQSASTDRPE